MSGAVELIPYTPCGDSFLVRHGGIGVKGKLPIYCKEIYCTKKRCLEYRENRSYLQFENLLKMVNRGELQVIFKPALYDMNTPDGMTKAIEDFNKLNVIYNGEKKPYLFCLTVKGTYYYDKSVFMPGGLEGDTIFKNNRQILNMIKEYKNWSIVTDGLTQRIRDDAFKNSPTFRRKGIKPNIKGPRQVATVGDQILKKKAQSVFNEEAKDIPDMVFDLPDGKLIEVGVKTTKAKFNSKKQILEPEKKESVFNDFYIFMYNVFVNEKYGNVFEEYFGKWDSRTNKRWYKELKKRYKDRVDKFDFLP